MISKNLREADILKILADYNNRDEIDVNLYLLLIYKIEKMLLSYPHKDFEISERDIYEIKNKIFEISDKYLLEIDPELKERSQHGFLLRIFISRYIKPPFVVIHAIDDVNHRRRTITTQWIISMYLKYLKLKKSQDLEPYDFSSTY